MAEITASMVKALREKTDAPMMECKKALTEANGDMERAEEILRVKLGTKANKAASRVAAEGVVAIEIAADGKTGVILEMNSETDFVAKNDDFLALAAAAAKLVLEKNPADVAALSALPMADGRTVEETRAALVGKIGENMSIRRFVRTAAKGKLASYIHGGSRIGVLIDLEGGDESLARDLAMHIAATKPIALSKEQVPADVIAKERSIAEQKAAESGKPAEIRQDGRWRRPEVPEGSDPAGPALREGRQDHRRAAAEEPSGEGRFLHPVRGWRRHREETGRLRCRSGRPGRRCPLIFTHPEDTPHER